MYVLALENGYMVVNGISSEDGFFVESSEVIPYGQILIDIHNKKREDYLNACGSIELLLKAHNAQRKGLIPLIPDGYPVPPMMLKRKAEAAIESLSEDFSDIDDIQYLNASYRLYRGKITPIFQVESLSQLYMFDLFQNRKKYKNRVRICRHCGKAFSGYGKSNAQYCDDPECKRWIDIIKQENFKDKDFNKIFKQICDRQQKRQHNNNDATYPDYLNNLYTFRDKIKDRERENIEKGDYSVITEYITALEAWDKTFFKLCTFYHKEDNNKVMANCIEQYESDREEWNKVKTLFPLNIDNPAAWLNEWIDRQNAVS